MESDLPDDRRPQATAANERILTKHGAPVSPVSEEEDVMIEARNVVSTVPLPTPKPEAPIAEDSSRDIKQSSVAQLSEEDFSEADL